MAAVVAPGEPVQAAENSRAGQGPATGRQWPLRAPQPGLRLAVVAPGNARAGPSLSLNLGMAVGLRPWFPGHGAEVAQSVSAGGYRCK